MHHKYFWNLDIWNYLYLCQFRVEHLGRDPELLSLGLKPYYAVYQNTSTYKCVRWIILLLSKMPKVYSSFDIFI